MGVWHALSKVWSRRAICSAPRECVAAIAVAAQGQPLNPLLQATLAGAFVRIKNVRMDTLAFAKSIGEVFQARADEDPIVNMKIESSDPLITPYASCRPEELSLHTDYATFSEPPRFTITHCLEPDPEFPRLGKSIVVELEPVLRHLCEHEPVLDQLLRERALPFRRNAEHDAYHQGVPAFPVLAQDRVRFDSTLILPWLDASDTEQDRDLARAVRRFEILCRDLGKRTEFALERWEVLIMDNRRVVHSRGPCSIRREGGCIQSREVNLAFLV